MGKARKLILCEVLNIALLNVVGVFEDKGMNGDTLLYIDLHIHWSDIACSIGSVHELSLICLCCVTT